MKKKIAFNIVQPKQKPQIKQQNVDSVSQEITIGLLKWVVLDYVLLELCSQFFV